MSILNVEHLTHGFGEQAKVRLCKLINRESNILVVDCTKWTTRV